MNSGKSDSRNSGNAAGEYMYALSEDDILTIQDLTFSFITYAGEVQAVRGVNLHVRKGETLGIVGESGCGKSVTAKTITRLNPSPPGKLKKGSIIFNGEDVTQYSEKQMMELRAGEIRMIFQDPMTSLNPTMRIGKQIVEGIRKSDSSITKAQAKERAVEMLKLVGLPNPHVRFKQYPHEFSGGMRQRAMIALAMAVNPKLLIADEPTTALDVTTQSQILKLMKDIQKEFETSLIMITHDLGVIANIASRVAVMYAGVVVETGTAEEIFKNPKHPYTWGLLKSVPRVHLNKKEDLQPIPGTPPDLFSPPTGCPFAPRCPYAMKVCRDHFPDKITIQQEEMNGGKSNVAPDLHTAACWLLHPWAPNHEYLKEMRKKMVFSRENEEYTHAES